MKKGLLAVALAAICTMGLTGCDRVEPGYVGIKVTNWVKTKVSVKLSALAVSGLV